MVDLIYNLDAGWSGLDQDSKWLHIETEEETVTLEAWQPANGITVKIQVTTTQLTDQFSTHTWQESPAGGATWYYLDKEGEVQSVDGASITAKMETWGNYFKSSADASAASKVVKTAFLKNHDDLEY